MTTVHNMPRWVFFLLTFSLGLTKSGAQHVLPVKLIAEPDSIDVAIFGNFTFDGSPVSSETLSSSGQSGFVVHSKPRVFGPKTQFSQILVDFNPIIVGMDPFSWNKLINQNVDSFYGHRMPYAEDAFLHIGLKRCFLQTQSQTQDKQKYFHCFFMDFYWRPYRITKLNNEFRFQTVNLSTGYQLGYLQLDIPVIGMLMVAPSFQTNYMYINESDQFLGSYRQIAGNTYKGNNYFGIGSKFLVQTRILNITTELRQYWALDDGYSGEPFAVNPTLLVGAFYNLNFYTRKSSRTPTIPMPN